MYSAWESDTSGCQKMAFGSIGTGVMASLKVLFRS